MTLEEVKQIPMCEVLERYGITPNRSGFIRCPFHKEKSASMKIYAKDAHCFGCGWYGDQIGFVQNMDNLTFKEAFIALGGSYNDTDKEEVRRKIRQAEIKRRIRAEKEAEMRQKKDKNSRYISALRRGIQYFPVFSDEWCFCQNELTYQLYKYGILNGIEVGT